MDERTDRHIDRLIDSLNLYTAPRLWNTLPDDLWANPSWEQQGVCIEYFQVLRHVLWDWIINLI